MQNVHTKMLRITIFVTCTRNEVQRIRGGKVGAVKIVTPEVVASKINNMKENKSPGVDGISPKILKETVNKLILRHIHTCLTCHCRRELFL